VAIGDPLYRPFKVTLENQGASPYVILRRAHLLIRSGQQAEALALLKGAMREQPSLPVGLALGKADDSAVAATLGFASLLKNVRPEDWPLLREIAGLLATHGARPAALQVYANLARAKAPAPEALKALLVEARQTADAAGDLKQSLEFARQLTELEPAVPAAK